MKHVYKFRGQRVDNKQWVYGNLIVGSIYGRLLVQIEISDSNNFRHYEVDPASVGQYTGRDDRHGFEIYEGMIVLVEVSRNHKSEYRVVWDNDQAGFYLVHAQGEGDEFGVYTRRIASIKNHEWEVKDPVPA